MRWGNPNHEVHHPEGQRALWYPLQSWGVFAPWWCCESWVCCRVAIWNFHAMKTSNLDIAAYMYLTGIQETYFDKTAAVLFKIHFLPSKEGYLQLAFLAHGQGKKLFRVRPKTHMMVEIGLVMQEQGQNGRLAMSPIATCTWSDEDFIGRISRCSRSSHGATISVSTMKKSLGMYSLQLKHLAVKKRQIWWMMARKIILFMRMCGCWGGFLWEGFTVENQIKILKLLKPL